MKPLIHVSLTPEERAERLARLLEPRPANPSPPGVPSAVSYQRLIIEPSAPRTGGSEKDLLTYDASEARLVQAGYLRHLFASEAFGLLIDSLESKLSGPVAAIAQDMVSSYGEWLSLAWKKQGTNLLVYEYPVVSWDGSAYALARPVAPTLTLDIGSQPSTQWIDLQALPDSFTQYHYGRSFAQLPQEMKAGGKRAQVYFHNDGTFWPVGRGGRGWCYRGGGSGGRASRGAKK